MKGIKNFKYVLSKRKHNGFVTLGHFNIYLRVTNRYIDNTNKRTVDIGSIGTHSTIKGAFRETLELIESLAKDAGFDGVYIEAIVNKWLPSVLERYGYILVNINAGLNMYKSLEKDKSNEL